MKTYDEIYAIASERHGKELAEKIGDPPKSVDEMTAIGDDRWLAAATKAIFCAGFNWKVVDAMWPGFEEAFEGFDVSRCAMLNEEDFDRLVSDTRIVRYGAKIRSVQENAVFWQDLATEHGSAAKAFASWPTNDFIGLLEVMKKRGNRLGGTTGQYFLRFMGVDSFILSKDVIARVVAEGVVDKAPTSKAAMAKVQAAYDAWMAQSGKSMKTVSRVLALSAG